ncbi:hypothetical protein BDW42DRAFT_167789 [Aspergillus taichungensis]|uniref:Uncharacterized protein n=1 Tax=Aspergillus taichungensis TaxID=482145 RepID=A0A2J5HX07_9EURO|nr:hypothetical protein BDW42DRAFT_167789 [Aspergillus taichungensis]
MTSRLHGLGLAIAASCTLLIALPGFIFLIFERSLLDSSHIRQKQPSVLIISTQIKPQTNENHPPDLSNRTKPNQPAEPTKWAKPTSANSTHTHTHIYPIYFLHRKNKQNRYNRWKRIN